MNNSILHNVETQRRTQGGVFGFGPPIEISTYSTD
jgi:hypothetical protein